jgi:hypothetical protein
MRSGNSNDLRALTMDTLNSLAAGKPAHAFDKTGVVPNHKRVGRPDSELVDHRASVLLANGRRMPLLGYARALSWLARGCHALEPRAPNAGRPPTDCGAQIRHVAVRRAHDDPRSEARAPRRLPAH